MYLCSKENKPDETMILIIRIAGIPETGDKMNETLFRIRLRRKYSAVLLKETKETMSLLSEIRNFVAYGKIDAETLRLLIEKRSQSIDKKKKVNADTIIENMENKSLLQLGIKPFFRLHPPRKGIDSKVHFGKGKGVLGDNKEKINDLVRRML